MLGERFGLLGLKVGLSLFFSRYNPCLVVLRDLSVLVVDVMGGGRGTRMNKRIQER